MGEKLIAIATEKIEVPKFLLWLFGGLTPASIVLGFIWATSWVTQVDDKIIDLTTTVEVHTADDKRHYDYYSHTKDFVPRTELEIKFDVINEKLDKLLMEK